MYVTICADLQQAEEFFPPSSSIYYRLQEQLTDFVLTMHHPVRTLTLDSLGISVHYIPNSFIINSQVWTRLVLNREIDYDNIPISDNFIRLLQRAYSEERPLRITFTNYYGRILELDFYAGRQEMNRVYMDWIDETHPGDYERWVMDGRQPVPGY